MTNSDKYFEELTKWKADYKALSQEIRDLKQQRKQSSPNYNSSAQWKREARREDANVMMLKREVLKERARAHWASQTAVFEAEVA